MDCDIKEINLLHYKLEKLLNYFQDINLLHHKLVMLFKGIYNGQEMHDNDLEMHNSQVIHNFNPLD